MKMPTSGATASHMAKMNDVLTDRPRVGFRPPSTIEIRKLSRLKVNPSVRSAITWFSRTRPVLGHAPFEPNIGGDRDTSRSSAAVTDRVSARARARRRRPRGPRAGPRPARARARAGAGAGSEEGRVRGVDVDEHHARARQGPEDLERPARPRQRHLAHQALGSRIV